MKKLKAVLDSGRRCFTLEADYSINRVNTSVSCEEHTHDYVEIVYTFSGKALHYVNGVPYMLEKGDMLFVNYGSSHALYPAPHSDYADIMLKPEFLDVDLKGSENVFSLLELNDFKNYSDHIKRDKLFIHFFGSEREQVESLIKITLSEQTGLKKGYELMQRSALKMLLNLFFRNLILDSSNPLIINDELISHIRLNCHERLTEADMAKRCHYTVEHFSRCFKRYTGKTFTEYLNSCRIDKAASLLSQTEKKVEDIFNECGFSNRTSFFNSFEAKMGCTPLQYRKISK